jgi:hypothetical protein
MRITEVHTQPMSVKVPSGWTSHESIPNSQLILVEVQSDDGLVSFGEIAGGPQKHPYNDFRYTATGRCRLLTR